MRRTGPSSVSVNIVGKLDPLIGPIGARRGAPWSPGWGFALLLCAFQRGLTHRRGTEAASRQHLCDREAPRHHDRQGLEGTEKARLQMRRQKMGRCR